MSSLCGFNSTAAAFVALSSIADNRLSVYDVANGAQLSQLVPEGHLNKLNACTALALGQLVKRKKKSKETDSLGLAAIGTERGVVLVWNLQSGELVYRLGEAAGSGGHSARVHDVAFHPTQPLLYSCSADKSVLEWSLESGEVLHRWTHFEHAQHRVGVSPDGRVLACASAELSLLDTQSRSVIRACVGGHSTPVTRMAFSVDSKRLVTGASDRVLTVWSTEADGSAQPLQSLSMDHEPVSVHVGPSEDGQMPVLAVTKGGSVLVWRLKGKKDSVAPVFRVNLSKKVAGKTGKADDTVLLAARFVDSKSLVIASGLNALPYFDTVAFLDAENRLVSAVHELARRTGGHLLSNAAADDSKKRKKAESVSVLGAENATMPSVTLLPSADADDNSADGKRAKRAKQLQKDDGEPTIEERIAAIQAAAVNTASSSSSAIVKRSAQPTADSLQSVLVQALQTDDSSLLEYCLSTQNAKMIERTVDRLPTASVLPFLTKVIDKFQSTPSRGIALITWIREILVRHTAYLLSVPSLSRALTGLYAVVDSRLASHRRMLGLSGRLDLLLAQIELRQRAAAVASASALEVAGEQHAAASVWDENDDELDEDQEDDAMLDGMDEDLDEEDDE